MAAASGELQPEPPAANAQTAAEKLKSRAADGRTPGGGPAEGSQREYVWRYAVRDMNVTWLGNAVVTALILVVAFIVWDKLAGKVAEGVGQWFLLVVVVLCVFLWLWQLGKLVYRKTIKYRLTPTHFYNEEGIFRRDTNTMELFQISDIQHSQNLLERFLCGGVGTIRLVSDDPTDPVLVIRGIVEHSEAFRLIVEYREIERQKKVLKTN